MFPLLPRANPVHRGNERRLPGAFHMLTRKQHELLIYLNKRIEETGISPSFEEMKRALGLKSKAGIHRHLTSLVERGFVERLPNRARAVRVVRKPEEAAAPAGRHSDQWSGLADLPFLGTIAAGTPVEAIQHESFVKVPPTMLSGLGGADHFALRIEGTSMIDAGILHGDIGIFRRQHTAEPGQIIIAFIDGREATLKRFRPREGSIELVPENRSLDPIEVHPSQLQIQGILKGLYRTGIR